MSQFSLHTPMFMSISPHPPRSLLLINCRRLLQRSGLEGWRSFHWVLHAGRLMERWSLAAFSDFEPSTASLKGSGVSNASAETKLQLQ